jgi:ATP-dependent RNA helicase DDX19/DBP5
MLSRVNPDAQYPQALCLSPTRELTRQTHDVVETMGKFTTIKVLEGVPGKRCMGCGGPRVRSAG